MSFNWEIYKELNPDLVQAGLKTKEQVENHYRVYGIREQRKTHINQVYPDFDTNAYRNNYPDLKNLDNIQIILHWLRYGKKEGRGYKRIIPQVQHKKYVQTKTLFIFGNNVSDEIITNHDYLNIIKNNHSLGINDYFNIYNINMFSPTYYAYFNTSISTNNLNNLNIRGKYTVEFYFLENLIGNVLINDRRYKILNICKQKPTNISNSLSEFYLFKSSELNALQLGILKGYKKIVLIGCNTSDSEWTSVLNYCTKNSINIMDTNKIKFSKIYMKLIDNIINQSINHWKGNKCISNYFTDDTKLYLLNSLHIKLQFTPNDKLNQLIELKKTNNNFNNRFMSFILILKNRCQRFEMFVTYLKKVENFNKYCELIIVEDISEHTVNLEILNNINYKYYLVNTGVGWSRSKLINYGLAKSNNKLSLFCDIDFIFESSFLSKFIKNFNTFNFDSLGLCIPVFETHSSFDNNYSLVRKPNENYGHVLVVSTNTIKKLGGFNFNINNHGFEERELWIRCLIHNYQFMFINNLYNDMYVLHVSHDEYTRGTNKNEKEIIINKLKNNMSIPFIWMLKTIKNVE